MKQQEQCGKKTHTLLVQLLWTDRTVTDETTGLYLDVWLYFEALLLDPPALISTTVSCVEMLFASLVSASLSNWAVSSSVSEQ